MMTRLKKKMKIKKIEKKKIKTSKVKTTKKKVDRPKKMIVIKSGKVKFKAPVKVKKDTIKISQDSKRTISLNKIKENLIEEKIKLEEQISKPTATPDSIDFSGDDVDRIQGKILVEVESHLKDREWEKLKKIENAIQRIEMESYGTCDDCGEPIPEKRLEANPHVLICIGCAEMREIEKQKGKI